MVRHCAWGTCRADVRYKESLKGARFITFPSPKTKLEACLRWIKACGRPHEQLNTGRINQNKVVCSTHFVGGDGPTKEFPDPIPACGSMQSPARPPPKKRRLEDHTEKLNMAKINIENIPEVSSTPCQCVEQLPEKGCQTDANEDLENFFHEKIQKLEEDNDNLRIQLLKKDQENDNLKKTLKQYNKQIKNQQTFTVEGIRNRSKQLKNLFKYYTGVTYVNFLLLFSFLFPDNGENLNYGRKDTQFLTNENALLLLLCRLRHDFGLKDIAMRFNLSLQSTGIVFNQVLDLMYFKFGQLSLWPHRDIIISKMPSEYKKDFPTSLIIIDGTEFRTQTPSALGIQSQLYSDYKSSTTLKALVGCDPSGTVIFISELFTGSISDKVICEQSGFFELLKNLLDHDFIQPGDAIMADKGFTIQDELSKLGLLLNIPPFASASQMSPADTSLTQRIAKHRVHIERVIAKIKTYKLLSHRIPTSLFKQANKIWTVSAMLTLYQDVFVKDK